MLNPATELVPPPSSPTISSISSSDFDTESTGSFFHDRSTTLGTLMGVNFPPITLRAPSQHRHPHSSAAAATTVGGSMRAAVPKKKKPANSSAAAAERRRRWWQLCRDGGDRPASLGEFLAAERRFSDGGVFYGTAAELEGMVAPPGNHGGRGLFADGRVLPPPVDSDDDAAAGSLCNRFPVSLTGICSGGAG